MGEQVGLAGILIGRCGYESSVSESFSTQSRLAYFTLVLPEE